MASSGQVRVSLDGLVFDSKLWSSKLLLLFLTRFGVGGWLGGWLFKGDNIANSAKLGCTGA